MAGTLVPGLARPMQDPGTGGSIQHMHPGQEIEADPMEVVLAKRALRSRIREGRACMSLDQREAGAARLSHDWLGLRGLAVAGYLATPTEPDPRGLLARAAEVLLPIPLSEGVLGWAIDDGKEMPHHRLPVSVPAGPLIGRGARALLDREVAIVIVPALAVSRDGWRLGQGGGYYDRLLAELDDLRVRGRAGAGSGSPLVVAVVYESELLDRGAVPHSAHDRPVSRALTPAGLVELGQVGH